MTDVVLEPDADVSISEAFVEEISFGVFQAVIRYKRRIMVRSLIAYGDSSNVLTMVCQRKIAEWEDIAYRGEDVEAARDACEQITAQYGDFQVTHHLL